MAGHMLGHVEDTGRREVMVGRPGKRAWRDAFRGRFVWGALVPGVTVGAAA